LSGQIRALYADARIWLHYLRLGQHQQARAVLLGQLDFWRGRTGNTRTVDLRLR
jgi:hypothetical protein